MSDGRRALKLKVKIFGVKLIYKLIKVYANTIKCKYTSYFKN